MGSAVSVGREGSGPPSEGDVVAETPLQRVRAFPFCRCGQVSRDRRWGLSWLCEGPRGRHGAGSIPIKHTERLGTSQGAASSAVLVGSWDPQGVGMEHWAPSFLLAPRCVFRDPRRDHLPTQPSWRGPGLTPSETDLAAGDPAREEVMGLWPASKTPVGPVTLGLGRWAVAPVVEDGTWAWV